MINLEALASLFFEPMSEPAEPNVMRMSHLLAIDYEPECQRLRSEGRLMRWVGETRLYQYSLRGWRPVTKRDSVGGPTVFMDTGGKLVLLYQAGE